MASALAADSNSRRDRTAERSCGWRQVPAIPRAANAPCLGPLAARPRPIGGREPVVPASNCRGSKGCYSYTNCSFIPRETQGRKLEPGLRRRLEAIRRYRRHKFGVIDVGRRGRRMSGDTSGDRYMANAHESHADNCFFSISNQPQRTQRTAEVRRDVKRVLFAWSSCSFPCVPPRPPRSILADHSRLTNRVIPSRRWTTFVGYFRGSGGHILVVSNSTTEMIAPVISVRCSPGDRGFL